MISFRNQKWTRHAIAKDCRMPKLPSRHLIQPWLPSGEDGFTGRIRLTLRAYVTCLPPVSVKDLVFKGWKHRNRKKASDSQYRDKEESPHLFHFDSISRAAWKTFVHISVNVSILTQLANVSARFSRALLSFAVGYPRSWKICSRISLKSCKRVCSRVMRNHFPW